MAPAIDSIPPTIQARYTSRAEPTACIISAGTRKMPLPMMVPTTIALAWLTPSSRRSVGAVEVLSAVSAISLRGATITADWNYKRLSSEIPRSILPDTTPMVLTKRMTEVIGFLLPSPYSRDVAISQIYRDENELALAFTETVRGTSSKSSRQRTSLTASWSQERRRTALPVKETNSTQRCLMPRIPLQPFQAQSP